MTTTHTVDTLGTPQTAGHVSLHHALPAVVVHTALRREFRLAGPLVGRVPDGDTARARLVGHHLDFLLRGLRHHHELEDDHIWPRLHARLPVASRQTLLVMQDQHKELDRTVRRVAQLLASWTTSPAAVAGFRAPLADELDALHRLLVAHLDLEERSALPLAELHLTPAEWHEIGRHAESGNPKDERLLVFGMLQYDGDPAVLKRMLATAPVPVRHLIPPLARRAYRRHALAIHGTPNP
jgi:hypothetical protein